MERYSQGQVGGDGHGPPLAEVIEFPGEMVSMTLTRLARETIASQAYMLGNIVRRGAIRTSPTCIVTSCAHRRA